MAHSKSASGKRGAPEIFVRAHWDAIASADFFTVEALTLHGLTFARGTRYLRDHDV